ncbi:MAG: hypothetical protein IJV08_05775 [Bacteroidaceae bacterium]|nr:hypothetical protein [Bacteroidaceae bacterium]
MKKQLFILWLCLLSLGQAVAQTTPSGSDYLVARPIPAKTLFYDYNGTGTLMPKIKWGLDLAWCSEANMKQGRNYLNLFNQNVGIVRLSFQPHWALSNNALSAPHINGELNEDGTYNIVGLAERLRVLRLLGTTPEIFLNCDPAGSIDTNFKGTTNTYVTRWVNLIKATGQYIEQQPEGFTVTGIAPFNEPDLRSTGYPGTSNTNTASMQSKICAQLKSDSWGKSKKTLGGNVLNPDYALTFYTSYKANIDEGNEHQLAGTAANFINFMTQVKNDGKQLCQDEMHNVMEAMVGANHGMNDGIWWGSSEHARTQFCRANDGKGYRLAYHEDTGTFTAASIYRNTQDGVTEAYLGCSERQATETSYGFVSKDRDVFYDGYGPTRAFYMHMPADPTGAYQTAAQKSAERVINIQSGEDVQPGPTVGDFQIMNASNGKVIQGNPSWTGWSANQATLATSTGADGQGWRIEAVPEDQGGDFSYYTIHSFNGQWWDYYLDDNEWLFDEANPIIMYPGGGSGCEQWYFVYAGNGSYYVHNRYSNLCLDIDGDNIVQRTRTNSSTQRWKLIDPNCQADLTAPAAPAGLTATPLLAAVQLSWTANAEGDLRGYTIVRTEKGKNDWNTIARAVEGTTYIDNTVVQGTEYTYKIKAIDLSCNLSAYSATVNGKTTGANGLVAQWEFDSNSRDKSTNGMNCALSNALYSDDNKSGSKALALDGTNYAQLPYSICNMPAMSFCAWVYWNGGSAWQRIFDFGTGEDSYLFLTPNDGSNMRFEIKANGSTQSLTTTKLSTGAWVHVAVTMAKNNVKIYVDGIQAAASTTITLTPADVAGICNYLGRSQFTADPMLNANLDDVRIYNYVLSAAEILEIAGNTEISDGYTEWAAGGTYYLYNVESGMFLNQGNAWGTQASLATEGLLWKVNNGSRTGLYRLNRTDATNYLFVAGTDGMYVDGDHDLDFAMTYDEETGLTRISSNPNGTYGTSAHGTTYVGWSGEKDITFIQPLLKPADHGKPGLNWQLLTATEYAAYQATIAEALSARQAMWPLLQNALATECDCTEAWETYRDIKSTAAQITAAHNALLTAFTAYVAANASASSPIEISYLIDHAGCGSDTYEGWTPTGTWASNTTYFRNGDAAMQGRFTESWVAGGESLEDRQLSQTLTNLPAGRYQASVDIIATQQGDASLAINGISLMLDDQSVNCSTANGVPQCFTTPALTLSEGSSPTLRLTVSGTNANWVAFDNFRLFYLGNGTPGDINKDGTVSIADVTALVNIVLGKDNTEPYQYDHSAADVNGDGSITIADVTALVNKVLGKD